MAKPNQIKRVVNDELKKRIDLRKLSQKSLNDIGKFIVDEMKESIAKGISPISGKRFPAYKNPNRYPGPLKAKRPVNLFLSGDFLNALINKSTTGKKPSIIILIKGRKEALKEKGHREGANGQRIRPIIPISSETFSKSISVKLRQYATDLIKKLL